VPQFVIAYFCTSWPVLLLGMITCLEVVLNLIQIHGVYFGFQTFDPELSNLISFDFLKNTFSDRKISSKKDEFLLFQNGLSTYSG